MIWHDMIWYSPTIDYSTCRKSLSSSLFIHLLSCGSSCILRNNHIITIIISYHIYHNNLFSYTYHHIAITITIIITTIINIWTVLYCIADIAYDHTKIFILLLLYDMLIYMLLFIKPANPNLSCFLSSSGHSAFFGTWDYTFPRNLDILMINLVPSYGNV